MFQHHIFLSTLLLFIINVYNNDASIPFCNRTEVLMHISANATSACVSQSEAENEMVFAKCCPLNYSYNTQTHSCKNVEKNRHQEAGFTYFKIGLRDCVQNAVVVDVVSDFKDLLIDENGASLKNENRFNKGEFCVDDVYNSDLIVIRSCSANLKECGRSRRCLRKCCPDLEIYVNGANCQPSTESVFDYKGWEKATKIADDGDFAIIHGLPCRKYIIKDNNTHYNLDEWGNINLLLLNNWKHYKSYEEIYCIEHLQRLSQVEDKVLMCMNLPLEKYNYTRIIMSVSCFFIFLTIISYIWLIENINVFSKAVISYCISLFGCFSLLTYIQWNEIKNKKVCLGLAYASTAFLISTFVWMNALCIDIWLTFGSDRALMTMKEGFGENKRFLFYSLYGWGLPIIITAIIALFKHSNFPPKYLRPLFGTAKCVIYSDPGNYSKLLLLVLPITILKICDVILFIRTSMYCIEVKNAITNMKDDSNSCDWKRRFLVDKERLMLLIRLFIIMGIPWLFEVLTSLFRFDLNPTLSTIESIWDVLNCLQGVYVFLIFVCKRKILESLLKKTKLKRRKLSLSSAVTQSSILVSRNCSGKR